MKVLKRDKTVEVFLIGKIKNAIEKAFNACGQEMPDDAMDCIKELYNDNDDRTVSVNEIQDNIERCLMSSYPDIAKAYMIYRYEHKVIRESKNKLIKGIEKKLRADNVENQNANVDEYSFGGRIGEASRYVTKNYALDYGMTRMARKNHLENMIYIHDLDSYEVGMHNCLVLPVDDLLRVGFNTRQTDVRKANSINTAFQLVAVLFQLQSLQQFGGVSASHLDWTMVPYIRKSFSKHYADGLKYINLFKFNDANDEKEWVKAHENKSIDDEYFKSNEKVYAYALDMTEKELKQAIEGMYHNLNTLQSRTGCQLPFTSINYGTCTSTEGRMVIKALLEGSLNGVGKFHKTPIFPCGIFQCMKGVNRKEGEPNYDLYKLALKSTSQRLYPNYANVDWSGNAGYDVNDPRTYFATMGK